MVSRYHVGREVARLSPRGFRPPLRPSNAGSADSVAAGGHRGRGNVSVPGTGTDRENPPVTHDGIVVARRGFRAGLDWLPHRDYNNHLGYCKPFPLKVIVYMRRRG